MNVLTPIFKPKASCTFYGSKVRLLLVVKENTSINTHNLTLMKTI